MRFFWRACIVFRILWLRQCHIMLRPHFCCLPSRFTIVGYLYWFLGLCGIWSFVFPGNCAPIPLTVPVPVLVVALRSVAEVAAFSPNTRFLSLVWGFLLLLKEFSRL